MKRLLLLPLFFCYTLFSSYAQPEELRVVRSLNLNHYLNMCLWSSNGLSQQIINAINSQAVKPYSINHYADPGKKYQLLTLEEVRRQLEIPQYNNDYTDEEEAGTAAEKIYYLPKDLYTVKITETAIPGRKKTVFKPAYLTLCISYNQSLKGIEEYIVSVLADEFLAYLKKVNAACTTPGIAKPEETSSLNEYNVLKEIKNDTLREFYSKLLTEKWKKLHKSNKSLSYEYILRNRLYHGTIEYFSNPKNYYCSDICFNDEQEIGAAAEYAILNSKNPAHDFFLIYDKYKTGCKNK